MKSWDEEIKLQSHSSWHNTLFKAIREMDSSFLKKLDEADDWLPGKSLFLKSFSIPMNKVSNILVGESPYPRKQSSCGYCFYDKDVKQIWDEKGCIAKKANKATSLRNFLKMLMVARGDLQATHTGKDDIRTVSKDGYIQTAEELFINKMVKENGFLLLNLSLSLIGTIKKEKEAIFWLPFMKVVFDDLSLINSKRNLILFGKVAKTVSDLESTKALNNVIAEHPYNISFIGNADVIKFFKDMDLLKKSN
ncbi:MAG: hypothetical protein QM500_13525 [Methylococcales bacterium]